MQREVLDVSLIVCTCNRPRLLEQTVTSVLQGDCVPADVVIVDQSDEPNEGVRSVASWAGNPVRHITSSVRGASRARNLGARAAKYDLLVFIDDDMRAATSWLGTLVQSLEQKGCRTVVTGRLLSDDTVDLGGQVPSLQISDTPVVHRGRLREDVLYSGNMAIRRSDLCEAGGFDVCLGPGTSFYSAEDNDLGARLLDLGYSIAYVPEAMLYHKGWRGKSSFRMLRWQYGVGQGAFYSKRLRVAAFHTLSRISRDVAVQLCLIVRLVRRWNKEAIINEVIYLAGLAYGLALWPRLCHTRIL